jgi:hypothetical protein
MADDRNNSSNAAQPLNVPEGICDNGPISMAVRRDVFRAKTFDPSSVSEAGRVTEVSPQSANALWRMAC